MVWRLSFLRPSMVANGHGGGVGFFLGLLGFFRSEGAGKVRLILRTDSTANGGQEDPRREREEDRPTDTTTKNRPPAFVRKKTGLSHLVVQVYLLEAQHFERSSTINFSPLVRRKPCTFARPPARPFDLLISCRPSVEGREGGGSHLGPSYAALLTLLTHPSHSLALPPLSAMRMRNIIVVETD